MSSVQRLIPPKLPTALAGHATVDIPGHDIDQCIVELVYVLPTKIDVAKFEEALSSALQIYPHSAGQLRCSDGCWFIELTNTGVPMSVDYKLGTTSDALLNGDWFLQDDLSLFLDSRPMNAYSVNDSGPLLRLKLTFLNNETCVGVSYHHALGDAMSILGLMHTLSQFYQSLPQEHPSPTFEKYHFPKPSPATSAEFASSVSHLRATFPLSAIEQVYAKFHRTFENLKWRIDDRDIAELHSILSARGHSKDYISQQDCLTAYVVAVLNHDASTPVRTVINLTSFRNISAPFVAKNVAGNLTLIVYAAVPTDMAGIAAVMRHAFVRCRKPDYVHSLMSVVSDLMLETANAGKGLDLARFDDTTVCVNSNTAVDWRSAHFGCPDGCRVYTSGMGRHYLRCHRSNPTRGDDGVWRDRHSVDISMAVPRELKPRLIKTLGRGIRYMLKNERARL